MGQLWDNFGTTLGQLWNYLNLIINNLNIFFGKVLGQLWDNFGTTLGQLWDKKGGNEGEKERKGGNKKNIKKHFVNPIHFYTFAMNFKIK